MEKQPDPQTGANKRPSPESYEPDTLKIVHRHLQDENHQITEEELKSVRISTEHFDKEYKNILDNAVETNEGNQKKSDADDTVVTPWDVTT